MALVGGQGTAGRSSARCSSGGSGDPQAVHCSLLILCGSVCGHTTAPTPLPAAPAPIRRAASGAGVTDLTCIIAIPRSFLQIALFSLARPWSVLTISQQRLQVAISIGKGCLQNRRDWIRGPQGHRRVVMLCCFSWGARLGGRWEPESPLGVRVLNLVWFLFQV